MLRSLLVILAVFGAKPMYAQVPENCVQLPQRTQVCPHLMYKKSPVKLVPYNIEQGQMVCICMADFNELRMPAEGDQEKIEQQVALSRLAEKLAIPERDLLSLIRD